MPPVIVRGNCRLRASPKHVRPCCVLLLAHVKELVIQDVRGSNFVTGFVSQTTNSQNSDNDTLQVV